MSGYVVLPHGAVAPFGRNIDFPLVSFVHPSKSDLPPHDEVPYHEQRWKPVAFRAVKDRPVDEPSRVINIYDAAWRRLLRPTSFFQYLIKDAIVEDYHPLFLGLDIQKSFVGFLIWIVMLVSSHYET